MPPDAAVETAVEAAMEAAEKAAEEVADAGAALVTLNTDPVVAATTSTPPTTPINQGKKRGSTIIDEIGIEPCQKQRRTSPRTRSAVLSARTSSSVASSSLLDYGKKLFTDITIGELIGGAKGILKPTVVKFVNEMLTLVQPNSSSTNDPLLASIVAEKENAATVSTSTETEVLTAHTGTQTDAPVLQMDDRGTNEYTPLMLGRNRKVRDNDLIELNDRAFYFQKDGVTPRGRSHDGKRGNAAIQKESRVVQAIINCILDEKLNEEQQVLALHKAAQHYKLRRIFKSANLIDVKEYSLFRHMIDQTRKLIEVARETNTKQGRPTDDRRMFVDHLVMAMTTTPDSNDNNKKKHSRASIIKALGLAKSTGHLIYKRQMEKRAAIRAKEEVTTWSSYKGRSGIWKKIPEETRQAVLDWIYKHPDVIPSPLGNDTVLVQDPDNLEDPKAKIPRNKVLLQCSIRELHKDLYSSKIGLDPAKLYKNDKQLVSDTAFRALLLFLMKLL